MLVLLSNVSKGLVFNTQSDKEKDNLWPKRYMPILHKVNSTTDVAWALQNEISATDLFCTHTFNKSSVWETGEFFNE